MWQLDGSWVCVRAPNRVPFWARMEEKRSFRRGRSAPSMWSPRRSEGASGTVRGGASGRGRVPPRPPPPSSGTSGLPCCVRAKAPASHLSVSCKAGDAACRVTALPGGDRQSPGSGREWRGRRPGASGSRHVPTVSPCSWPAGELMRWGKSMGND